MVAPLLLVVAAALCWRPASGRLAQSAASDEEFVCSTDARSYDVAADYRIWRSARVRVASSNSAFQCNVNVTLATSSEPPLTGQPPQLMLVIIEAMRLSQQADLFYALRTTIVRQANAHCIMTQCGPSYLWTSQSVGLHFYVNNSAGANVSYEAAFVVTEATNMCGLANRTGELLVQSGESGEYAFASNSRHEALPPNNVACTPNEEYSLTLRPSVSSALLNVTVLACPCSNDSGALKLNGRNCSDGMTVVSEQAGSNVTLRYVLSLSCSEDHNKSTGFVVSAQVIKSTKTPPTLIVVAASVAAALAVALAGGIAVALLYRHRLCCRQRLPGRRPPSSAVHHVPSSASAGDEEIPMVGNDLYGVTLASRTTADRRSAAFASA